MVLLVKVLFTLFLAVWLGSVVFLSAVAAPVLFSSMPAPEAGGVMSLLFPWYYRLGYVCGAITAGGAFYLWRNLEAPALAWFVNGVLATVALLACLYSGVIVQPRAHELRDEARRAAAPNQAEAEFDRLHALAVRLNGGVLVLTLAIAGITASRLR